LKLLAGNAFLQFIDVNSIFFDTLLDFLFFSFVICFGKAIRGRNKENGQQADKEKRKAIKGNIS
jgi:hypothetical protein